MFDNVKIDGSITAEEGMFDNVKIDGSITASIRNAGQDIEMSLADFEKEVDKQLSGAVLDSSHLIKWVSLDENGGIMTIGENDPFYTLKIGDNFA